MKIDIDIQDELCEKIAGALEDNADYDVSYGDRYVWNWYELARVVIQTIEEFDEKKALQ